MSISVGYGHDDNKNQKIIKQQSTVIFSNTLGVEESPELGKRKDGKKKRHWRITKALKEESLVIVNKTKDVGLHFEATSPSF